MCLAWEWFTNVSYRWLMIRESYTRHEPSGEVILIRWSSFDGSEDGVSIAHLMKVYLNQWFTHKKV